MQVVFYLFLFLENSVHICTTVSCKCYKEKRYKVLFLRILSAELILSWLTLFLLCQLFVTVVLVAWCSHCTKHPECWSSKTQQHIEYKSKWNQKDLGWTEYEFGVRRAVCQDWNLVSKKSNLLSGIGLN